MSSKCLCGGQSKEGMQKVFFLRRPLKGGGKERECAGTPRPAATGIWSKRNSKKRSKRAAGEKPRKGSPWRRAKTSGEELHLPCPQKRHQRKKHTASPTWDVGGEGRFVPGNPWGGNPASRRCNKKQGRFSLKNKKSACQKERQTRQRCLRKKTRREETCKKHLSSLGRVLASP